MAKKETTTKKETTVSIDSEPRFTRGREGEAILVNVAFMLDAETIKTCWNPGPKKIKIERVLKEGDVEKRVHWFCTQNLWDKLVKAKLAPNYFANWKILVSTVTPREWENEDGETMYSLSVGLRPLEAEDGVSIGSTSDNVVVGPARSEKTALPTGDSNEDKLDG